MLKYLKPMLKTRIPTHARSVVSATTTGGFNTALELHAWVRVLFLRFGVKKGG